MNNAERAKVCESLLPYHHKEWWHLPWLLCSDCFGAKRRVRKRGILTPDSEAGFVADGIYVGQDWTVLTPILGEGFACSLPDVPWSCKSIEATSAMCLGVGKVFLCHWTLDQRGVKDCLCPFSIAAAGAGSGRRKHQLPLLSLELGLLSPALLPRQTWAFPVLPYFICGWVLSVVNLLLLLKCNKSRELSLFSDGFAAVYFCWNPDVLCLHSQVCSLLEKLIFLL